MRRSLRCAALVWIACLAASLAEAQSETVSANTAFYVRTDSDRTTVVSPRVHVGGRPDRDTRLDVVYTVDVWSSASIDIRSAATKRVVEQRDELDVSLERAIDDLTFGASYRYSVEHDYASHGGSFGASYDLAQHATTLAATLRASIDRVGRAGDPAFERRALALSARASLTQVIDPMMWLQLVYELTRQEGYLASPYRFVRIADSVGPTPGPCVYPSTSCEREQVPAERLRHALAIYVRRALGDSLSLAVSYRYYRDDWQLHSHTAALEASWIVSEGWMLALEYRFYVQSAVWFSRPFYAPDPLPVLRTSDKESAALVSHRVALELAHSWSLDAAGTSMRAVLRLAPSWFLYDDVPWLHSIQALESSVSAELLL